MAHVRASRALSQIHNLILPRDPISKDEPIAFTYRKTRTSHAHFSVSFIHKNKNKNKAEKEFLSVNHQEKKSSMASTACFLHHRALTTATRSSSPSPSPSQRQVANIKPSQLVCRAQKQAVQEDDGSLVSRRMALTVLIGAAAVGSKVSPADAAYGEAGNFLSLLVVLLNLFCHVRK